MGALCVAMSVTACLHRRDREPAREAPAAEVGADARADDDLSTVGDPELPERSTDRANADDPGAGTSARSVSQRIVEEGKGHLIAGNLDVAADRFERALRIDPTNGFAYFYLGRTRYETGDRDGALGMLDKAEALLGPYPVWRARVARLQAALNRSPR